MYFLLQTFFYYSWRFNVFYIKSTLKLAGVVTAVISGFINSLWKRNGFFFKYQKGLTCAMLNAKYIYSCKRGCSDSGVSPCVDPSLPSNGLKKVTVEHGERCLQPWAGYSVCSCPGVEDAGWGWRAASSCSPSTRDRKVGDEERGWSYRGAPEHVYKVQG